MLSQEIVLKVIQVVQKNQSGHCWFYWVAFRAEGFENISTYIWNLSIFCLCNLHLCKGGGGGCHPSYNSPETGARRKYIERKNMSGKKYCMYRRTSCQLTHISPETDAWEKILWYIDYTVNKNYGAWLFIIILKVCFINTQNQYNKSMHGPYFEFVWTFNVQLSPLIIVESNFVPQIVVLRSDSERGMTFLTWKISLHSLQSFPRFWLVRKFSCWSSIGCLLHPIMCTAAIIASSFLFFQAGTIVFCIGCISVSVHLGKTNKLFLKLGQSMIR